MILIHDYTKYTLEIIIWSIIVSRLFWSFKPSFLSSIVIRRIVKSALFIMSSDWFFAIFLDDFFPRILHQNLWSFLLAAHWTKVNRKISWTWSAEISFSGIVLVFFLLVKIWILNFGNIQIIKCFFMFFPSVFSWV